MLKSSMTALLVALLGGVPAAAQDPVTAFVNVAVVPMDRERVLTDQTVLVQGGRIAALGPAGQVRIPAGAVRIDGRGKFLIPGLVDMHVHVPSLGKRLSGQLGGSALDGAGEEEAERMLYLLVANGVTTVRIMLSDPDYLALRQRAAHGDFISPRIYLATDGLAEGGQGFQAPLSSDAAAEYVRESKASGYDLIKMYGIGGEAFDSVVAAAHHFGIPIAGHVPDSPQGLQQAVRAGYASIEHLNGFGQYLLGTSLDSTISGWPVRLPIDSAKLLAVARQMRNAGIWNCPTQMVWEFFDVPSIDSIMRLPETRYIRNTADYRATRAEELARNRAAGVDAVISDRRRIVKMLHDAGVGILLGTDASQPFLVPGFTLHRELQALVRAGFTSYEALVTGTRNPAAYFGTQDSVGTITVGKRADLVLLTGNPLEDIRHTAQPAGVMLHGRWLDRAELDKSLKAIEGTLE